MKASEIAELVGGELSGDGDVEIDSAADLLTARTGQLAFHEKAPDPPETGASCLIVSRELASILSSERTALIRVKDPKLAFARAAAKLHLIEPRERFVHPTATVAEDSVLGESCQVHEGVRIGSNVSIGKLTTIHPNCVIYDHVKIGDRCVIHAGTVIGADGFGYVKDEDGIYVKFPQIGTVLIEDNVEIGANSCIDRGALGETRIGEGTKIDNLVQVGHNVNIGKRCVIAAQTGISGSVVIEDDCVIGGQVGFGDHVRVQSGAIIGSQAGVLPGKIVRPGVWWGTPIQPLEEFKRQNAHVKGIERLKAEVKALRSKLADLEKEA